MAARFLTPLLLAVLIGTPAVATVAQGPFQVTSKIFVEQRSLDKAGAVSSKLVPARRAVPGDHVVFVLAYRNTGAQPLSDIVLDNPVPGAIAYRAPGGTAATPELSVDGRTYGTLAQLRVPSAGGGNRAATPNDVRHVRWRIATVPAGGQGQFAFKAVLK